VSLHFLGPILDAHREISAQWKQYYSAREVYGSTLPGGWSASAPLTPAFWHQSLKDSKQNDELFRQFLAFKWRGINVETCPPGDCKDNAICALRAGRSENNCVSHHFLRLESRSRYKRLSLLPACPSAGEIKEKGRPMCPAMNVRVQALERSSHICRAKWCVTVVLMPFESLVNGTLQGWH